MMFEHEHEHGYEGKSETFSHDQLIEQLTGWIMIIANCMKLKIIYILFVSFTTSWI